MRVVTERIPTLKSVTVGIWVNTGSRDELPRQAGYSHFIEHMFFKGTRSRTAVEISREIDGLGGEMNAFTTRETTTFYVKVLDQQLPRALELLSDLFHHSQFDPKELEKEKQVVLEEIRMVQDDPEDFVQELHTGQVLGPHPLGSSILGKEDTIRRLRRQDLMEYIDAHYDPRRIVIAIAGNFNPQESYRLVSRYFGKRRLTNNSSELNRRPPDIHGGVLLKQKPLEQAHLCIGLKGIAAGHRDRYAVYALNSILGGSVSSRLFQEVREKRGLVYSIYSFLSGYSDAGTMTVYAGTRAKEVDHVVDLVCREIKRINSKGVEKNELVRAKNQMKGSLMLSLESSHSRMSKLAKDELIYGSRSTMKDIISHIDRVTVEHVHDVGQRLLNMDRLAITGLGPIQSRALASYR
ncbi:pitrilysin family protein [Nitrospira sp. KM1]|uniref:M16 family metallopeptidase n=1 Tax=Nitrospira sp. KM1 TaxID=1936990 RepID=UPI001E614EFE|nr:pitrilysin family protein [Nitrospira sp. KM1]